GEGTFLQKGSLSPLKLPSLPPSQDFRPYRIPVRKFGKPSMREGETQESCEKRDSRPEPMVPGGFVVSGRGRGKEFLKGLGMDFSQLFNTVQQ
ncbi:hypothetical protein, partial [Bilophila wadsworthia]